MLQRSLIPVAFATVQLLICPIPGQAQDDDFAKPVAELVERIERESKEHSLKLKLLIIPFALSEQFQSRLQNKSAAFEVIDAGTVKRFFSENYLNASTLSTTTALVWVGDKLGADVVLNGEVSNKRGGFDVRISVFQVKREATLTQVRTVIRKTKETKTIRITQPLENPDENGVYGAGTKDLPLSKCDTCGPPFPKGSNNERWEGTVTLLVVINEQGRVVSAVPLRTGPPKFTEKAIETVRGWTLSPFRGPDGRPVLLRLKVEVVFRGDGVQPNQAR